MISARILERNCTSKLGDKIKMTVHEAFLEQDLLNLQNKIEEKDKRIATLEKENAELKEDNSEWEKASDKWKSVYELTNNQLTKAKEIIKDFLLMAEVEHLKDRYETVDEAEQFLKNNA